VNILKASKREGYNSRLFLFSDGLVNHGLTSKPEIMRNVADIYEKTNIQISAFGLGEDFDEELMKGIADKGIGAYFFIENSAAIPTFVEFALKSVQQTVGTNAVIKARGTNTAVVEKFYGDHNVVKGAMLGDLRADNTRTILARVKVSPTAEESDHRILECELTYSRDTGGIAENFCLIKNIAVNITTDPTLVEKHADNEVKIQGVLQNIVKLDKKLATAMSNDNSEKVISILEKEITLLGSVEEIDNVHFGGTNKVASLLAQVRSNLKNYKEKGATKQQIKEVHHRGYTAARG